MLIYSQIRLGVYLYEDCSWQIFCATYLALADVNMRQIMKALLFVQNYLDIPGRTSSENKYSVTNSDIRCKLHWTRSAD